MNSGTLTLKAGSVVTELDGNYTRTAITIDTTVTSTANGTRFVFYDATYNSMWLPTLDTVTSGDTLPSAVSGQYLYHFKTDDKRLYQNAGTTTWQLIPRGTFPIAVVTVSGGAITSIDQVFNGFGYLGSTVFALPGVKVQIPNGRNIDGTFDSIIRTLDTVKIIKNDAYTGTYSYVGAFITPDDTANTLALCGRKETGYRYFDDARNCWVYYNDGSDRISINVADLLITSGKITTFTLHNVDSVTNSNASNLSQAGRSYLSTLPAPTSSYTEYTVGASGAWYVATDTGWVQVYGIATGNQATSEYVQIVRGGNFSTIECASKAINMTVCMYVEKGDVFQVNYRLNDGALAAGHIRLFKAKGVV